MATVTLSLATDFDRPLTVVYGTLTLRTDTALRFEDSFGNRNDLYGQLIYDANGVLIDGTLSRVDWYILGQFAGRANGLDISGTELLELTVLGGLAAYYPAALSGDGQIIGSPGDDRIYGYDGNDTLRGNAGQDTIFGGGGNDRLTGGNDADALYGEAGADTLLGGTGVDRLWGGDGQYSLNGEDGNDTLDGGSGNDTLVGGNGLDRLFEGVVRIG